MCSLCFVYSGFALKNIGRCADIFLRKTGDEKKIGGKKMRAEIEFENNSRNIILFDLRARLADVKVMKLAKTKNDLFNCHGYRIFLKYHLKRRRRAKLKTFGY